MGMIYLKNKGIVKKMLYGNGDKDFNDSLLPKTRKEQFKYILKNNWQKLFYLNMIMFLFFVPALFYFLLNSINYNNIVSNMTDAEIYAKLFSLNLVPYLILTGLLMIGFIGLSGGSYILRKMAFDEVVELKNDLKKGIKYSSKQYMFVGFLFGMTIFAFNYSVQYVGLSKIDPFIQFLLFFIIVLVFVSLLISFMYMLNLSNLYIMKITTIIKCGLILTFRELFKNLGVLLLAFIPVFGWLILSGITTKVVMILILFVFGFSYVLLLFTLISMYAFDKYINPTQYPDYVRRGLCPNE